MMNKTVLTIAGSDSSGGAGIQADLKVMTAYGVYGMSVITAVTAQNTLGVHAVRVVGADTVCAQLNAVLSDIRPDAVKIGMVCTEEIVHSVARAIDRWELENIVVDPVMVSTSGRSLLDTKACGVLKKELFQGRTWLRLTCPRQNAFANPGGAMGQRSCPKSSYAAYPEMGHCLFNQRRTPGRGSSGLLLCSDGKMQWYEGKRIDTVNTHGTGCTYSTAIACNLAKGMELSRAIREAKTYLEGAIRCNPGLGAGHGPLNHCWRMEESI